jgi:alpha-1,3-glucan synthase
MIAQLDIDGFRFDKATQVTVDAQGEFGDYIRQCARRHGKENFFLPGGTGRKHLGSIYLGRGRQPDMLPDTLEEAVKMTNNSDNKFFVRDHGKNALDAAAFHYTVYRSLTRFAWDGWQPSLGLRCSSQLGRRLEYYASHQRPCES